MPTHEDPGSFGTSKSNQPLNNLPSQNSQTIVDEDCYFIPGKGYLSGAQVKTRGFANLVRNFEKNPLSGVWSRKTGPETKREVL